MSMAKKGGFGFLKISKARQAEEAIARSGSIITVLQLKDVDLTAPGVLLQGAKEAFESRNYTNVLLAARAAERIAIKLEETHNAYARAHEALDARMEEIGRFGIPVDAMKAALERAKARVASDLESGANPLRAEFIEAPDTLAATSAVLGELREKGVFTGRLGSQLAIARDVLHRGVIDPAADMVRRLFDDARTLGDGFAKATAGIADATNRYSTLVREGHLSAAADRSILDARRAVRDGRYTEAVKNLEEAKSAILRAEAERESLGRSLREHRHRVTAPANATPFFPEASEILGRAEKVFKDGDYSGSIEDIVLAPLLLGPVAPKAGSRRKDAPAGNS